MATLYKMIHIMDDIDLCTEEEVKPMNGTDFSLEELQYFVGGLIEIVWLKDGKIMVVNEEGKLNGSPMNVPATQWYRNSVGVCDYIAGNALVCNDEEVR